MKRRVREAIFGAMAIFALAAGPIACGSDNPPPPPEQAGQACSNAGQCYSNVTSPLMGGAPVCLDRVTGGYCTHVCTADTDCCAVPGECRTSYPQVCSPFESTGMKYCFLSCEDGDFADSGVASADGFCATYAHADFSCRSSGGGSQNRKVCVP